MDRLPADVGLKPRMLIGYTPSIKSMDSPVFSVTIAFFQSERW
jgi:hypothetical protein